MLGVPHSTSRRISNLDLVIFFWLENSWSGMWLSMFSVPASLFHSQHYTYLNFICSFNNSIFLQGQGNILLLCHYTAQYWIHFKHSLCRVFIKLRQFLNSYFLLNYQIHNSLIPFLITLSLCRIIFQKSQFSYVSRWIVLCATNMTSSLFLSTFLQKLFHLPGSHLTFPEQANWYSSIKR